jgi:hypothetical protein
MDVMLCRVVCAHAVHQVNVMCHRSTWLCANKKLICVPLLLKCTVLI